MIFIYNFPIVTSVVNVVALRCTQMAGYCTKFELSQIFTIFVLGYSVSSSVCASNKGNLYAEGITSIVI